MPKRLPLPLLTAPLLAWSASSAVALGFGAAPGTAVLGAPLDFRVPIRLEPTESLDTACVAATVTSGQSLVPPEMVDIALEGQGSQRTLRVATRLVITEPLVTVTLSAGCSSRITRRFTLFADPPGHRIIPLPQPPSVEALAQAAAARAPVVQPAAAVSAGATTGATAGAAAGAATPPADASAAAAAAAAGTGSGAASGAPSGATPTASTPAARPDVAQDKAPPPVVVAGGGAAAQVAASDENLRRPPSRVTSKIRVRASATAAPVLKLEAPQISPSVVAAAALAEREAAARQAEEIAAAAKAAAAAAEAKAAALERSVAALQQQLKAQRESIEQLTLSLRNTSSYGLPWPWMAAVALLALLTLWLGIRLRRARRDAEGWWTAGEPSAAEAAGDPAASAVAGAAETSPAAPSGVDAHAPDAAAEPSARSAQSAASGAGPASWPSVGLAALASTSAAAAAAAKPEAAPLPSLAFAMDDDRSATPATPSAAPEMPPLPALEVVSDDDEEVPASERTQLMPSGAGMSAPLRAVSIEELLDLEQQVEFFTVLGQDDAAIGLLVDHLRHTGGTYPLPYLKLMEFYRRKGDEDAYGRIRDRFNGRFNAVAPAWGAAKGTGRSLDDYPEVLRQITPVWSRPVDAMALLENMLFRTQAGAMFDLAALSDVLFLFTLARDLHEHDGGGGSDVDVLLPLDGEPEPAPAVGSGSGLVAAVPSAMGPVSMPAELGAGFIASRPMPLSAAGEPSEPLDFDLTTSGDPDHGSVASVDLEFDAFAAAPSPGVGSTDDAAGGIDIPLDAPSWSSGSSMGEPVPERADSGYFDLPPLAEQGRAGRQAGLAPLPAPGGDQRRSDPPMDFDIPLDDATSPAWGQPASGRTEPTSSREPGEPMDFNLDLMELAPMERRDADKASSISALDIDLPITPAPPPTTGRR